ncbi:hypothetical protein H0X10_03165 [Candidatus Saccharibacteria bacterium]|nr:hypothetical protein [Candidatus Saccharibacteria bacterium]
MPTLKKKSDFFETAEGLEIARALREMDADNAFSTIASYSANAAVYPDNLIPFVDKHMNYLKQHQNVNPVHYLSNLRLMTKIKVKLS